MDIVILILIFFLCWLGVTIYNLVVILKIKGRLFELESTVSRLRARWMPTPAENAPSAERQKPDSAMPETPPAPSFVIAESRAAEIPDIPAASDINVQLAEQNKAFAQSTQSGAQLDDRLNYFERLVGTRWLNWIGTLVTLAGTAFLLKWMYDRGWIGPAGRVSVGMVIGGALLYLGEVKFRKLHNLFSQSVSAAGCGALFLTAYFSFKFYEFSGRTATFAFLCWFALFAVALAVVRRGPVLAFLGLLNAYLTPYLLSTGQDQAETLFTYLAVLALACAAVNAACDWRGIVSLCFAFSWIYYVGWYSRFYTSDRLLIAAIGAAGLIIFSGIAALLRSLWNKKAVCMEECIVLAAAFISGLYFLWDDLNKEHELVLGFVLCGLTLVALAALNWAGRRNALTPIAESTLLGLASGSLLLVIPACFKADGAMLAWALAAVIFADMGARARRTLLEIAAGFCLLAGLCVGLSDVSHSGVFIPIANSVFLAWLGIILAWFTVGKRYFREIDARLFRNIAGQALQIAASFMLIGLLSYEVIAWFRGQIQYTDSNVPLLRDWRNIVLFLLWALYPWLWLLRAKARSRLYELSSIHYGVLGLMLLLLLAIADFHNREPLVFLNPVFLASLLLPAGIFLVSTKIGPRRKMMQSGLQVFAHFLCVVLVAVEMYQGLYLGAWSASNREWIRIALISVAWAVYATFLLGIGVSRNLRPWRWFALALLGVTLIKVLFIDMAEVRQIWRVLSFMALGALLMICSYVYSRNERMKRIANISAPDKEVNL